MSGVVRQGDFLGPNDEYRFRVGITVKTLHIDRSLFSRGQEYELRGQDTKNATQADVDKNYLRLFSGMEDSTGASNQMTNKELQVFMAKNVETSGGSSQAAFDGQLARLGGIAALNALPAVEEEPADGRRYNHVRPK